MYHHMLHHVCHVVNSVLRLVNILPQRLMPRCLFQKWRHRVPRNFSLSASTWTCAGRVEPGQEVKVEREKRKSHLKPAISLLLRPVCHELEDGGWVVAGVVLLAVGEVDARDELPVDDLVLLHTVHLNQCSVVCSIRRKPILESLVTNIIRRCSCSLLTCPQLMIALFFNHLRLTPGSLNSTSKLYGLCLSNCNQCHFRTESTCLCKRFPSPEVAEQTNILGLGALQWGSLDRNFIFIWTCIEGERSLQVFHLKVRDLKIGGLSMWNIQFETYSIFISVSASEIECSTAARSPDVFASTSFTRRIYEPENPTLRFNKIDIN